MTRLGSGRPFIEIDSEVSETMIRWIKRLFRSERPEMLDAKYGRLWANKRLKKLLETESA
jgi:hypothetical protein